jgi:predicted N-formylglutamate amidohydrolase
MTDATDWQEGADRRLLLVCDHAANAVPPGVTLGLPAAVMETHIALDIGAGPLTRALATTLDAPALLARWSRLVADCNRPSDSPSLAPESSDGIDIPGNRQLDAAARARRLGIHRDFHALLADRIAKNRPALIISIHSFTPALASAPAARPWPVAVLWNRDDRAARLGLAALAAETDLGGPVGANEPYSGRVLNYTMDRHAEAAGIPYLGFEIRQDGLADAAGVARWAAILARVVRATLAGQT